MGQVVFATTPEYNPVRVTSLALAIQFLTVIPIPGRLVWTHPATVDFGRALAFFPVVGLLIGAGGLALDTIFRPVLGVSTSSALVTLYFVVITGALHLDGFLDTCDGVFLSRKERRLDAMRDSRLGSYAVAGGSRCTRSAFWRWSRPFPMCEWGYSCSCQSSDGSPWPLSCAVIPMLAK
ncbi:MAG: hypothetical protein EXR45_06010 [Chloroflexi bacterium]|nr:hypothetical protein [Chloroflexota bacterium]